jgi:hypothetical protein
MQCQTHVRRGLPAMRFLARPAVDRLLWPVQTASHEFGRVACGSDPDQQRLRSLWRPGPFALSGPRPPRYAQVRWWAEIVLDDKIFIFVVETPEAVVKALDNG